MINEICLIVFVVVNLAVLFLMMVITVRLKRRIDPLEVLGKDLLVLFTKSNKLIADGFIEEINKIKELISSNAKLTNSNFESLEKSLRVLEENHNELCRTLAKLNLLR